MQPSINQMSGKFHSYVCPIFCLLRVRVCLNEANFDWNLALDLTDRGRDLSREHWHYSLVFQDSIKFLDDLIMYSCSKCLPYHCRWIAGLSFWKLWYFCNSWEKLKILLPSFLRYFDWYHMHFVFFFNILKKR